MSATPPTPPDEAAPAGGRRIGRPPRISRELIAQAAVEIGLTDLTLRAVADHLGVTTAALYHHVDGKDDLLRLAAERQAGGLHTPTDHGQHWAAWLLEWALHTRDAFADDPALLEQFLDGVISTESVVHNMEAILDLLVRQGFTPDAALRAYRLVSVCALGAAVSDVRDRRSIETGRGSTAERFRALVGDEAEGLPLLRTGSDHDTTPREAALGQFRDVIVGVAVLRGDDPDEVGAVLDTAIDGLRRAGPRG